MTNYTYLLENIYPNYFNLFFDPTLNYSTLFFFQFLSYYIILMSIVSSIVGVFDINKGNGVQLATLNSKSANIQILVQAFFCFLVLFISDNLGFFFEPNYLELKSFFIIDNYVILASLIVCLSGLLILGLSSSYILQTKKDTIELPTFISFSVAFMIFFISSNNLMAAFISLEGLSFILYVLAALNFSSHASIEAAIKYFCLGGLSSGILLFGISLLYGITGTLNFMQLRDFFITKHVYYEQVILRIIPRYFWADRPWLDSAEFQPEGAIELIYLVIILILVGFLFKLSAYPFHVWTPDVYEGAPLIVTAFFAIVVKFTIMIFFIRFINFIFYCVPIIYLFLTLSALGSLIIGGFGALKQKKIKRFIAYTSINQVGFLLLGLSCNTFHGNWATILHLLMYMLMSFALFAFLLGVTNFFDEINLTYLYDLSKFAQKNSGITFLLVCILFSMAGIPPLGGFFGKYYILLSITAKENYLLAIITLLINVISCFYYIRIIQYLWFGSKKIKTYFFFYNTEGIYITTIFSITLFLCGTLLFLPNILDFCIFISKNILPL